MNSRTLALMLAMTPGFGGKSVARVMARNGLLSRSADEFLGLGPESLKEEYRLSAKAIANLLAEPKANVKRTKELEDRLGGLGVSLVTAADAHYPQRIEQMDADPPGVLFLYGNARLLDAQTFSVLGSRNSRPAELNHIERLTEEGVLGTEVLVTGHDRPEYQRSAVVPLRWGAPRVLCLDRGLFNVLGPDLKDEAFRAARLWRYEFDPKTDLVVSPFRPASDFIGANNRIRDRLIGALSDRIDFVSLSEGGNMAALARSAMQAGRAVRVSDTILDWRRWVEAGAIAISPS